MAVKGCKGRIFVDQYDFSLDTNGITIDFETPVLESSTFQACDIQKQPSLNGVVIKQNGYFDDGAEGGLDKEINDRLGVAGNFIVTTIIGTDQTIPVAYSMNYAFAKSLNLNTPVVELITINAEWVSQGTDGRAAFRGYQVYYGTLSATGAVTGIDFGAAVSAGGKAFLHIVTITGTATNAQIKIQSDSASNFATAADEGTFTFSAVGTQTVDLSGTVNRYVRANVVTLGGATSFLVALVVCTNGGTY